MRRLMFLAVVVVVLVVPLGGALGQTALSPGCSALNDPVHDEQAFTVLGLVDGPFLAAERMVVTFDFNPDSGASSDPIYAQIGIGFGGVYFNPFLEIDPAEDGVLEYTFDGTESLASWAAADQFSDVLVTVTCVAGQAPPTTTTTTEAPPTTTTTEAPSTTTTTILEVETDISDSGSAGMAAAALLGVGLLVLGFATVRSYRPER